MYTHIKKNCTNPENISLHDAAAAAACTKLVFKISSSCINSEMSPCKGATIFGREAIELTKHRPYLARSEKGYTTTTLLLTFRIIEYSGDYHLITFVICYRTSLFCTDFIFLSLYICVCIFMYGCLHKNNSSVHL